MALPLDRPPQNRLEIPFMEASGADLAALAAVSWRPESEFLAFSKLAKAPNWENLWSGPDMALQELRL